MPHLLPFLFYSLIALCLQTALLSASHEVLGIGAPCMDHLISVEEEDLRLFSGEKGNSRVVSWPHFQKILSLATRCPHTIRTGGSCSNTMKGLASLGHSTAFFGRIGNDQLGKEYVDNIRSVGILPLLIATDLPTQQVACLITPDSQRSMFCCLGAVEKFQSSDLNPEHFHGVKLVFIEGYAFYNGDLAEKAMILAKEAGAKVALDLASCHIVNTFKKSLTTLLAGYVDIVFANEEETQALTGLGPIEGSQALASLCKVAVVKVGKNGCFVSSSGHTLHCPGFTANAVDTTGAGDLFASGFLHSFLKGKSLSCCGKIGNLTGSAVVEVIGSEIPADSWNKIKNAL